MAAGRGSLRPLVEWWADRSGQFWRTLGYSVRTGLSAREADGRRTLSLPLDRDAALADTFHGAMRAMTALVSDDVVAWPGWQDVSTVVDVGGGMASCC